MCYTIEKQVKKFLKKYGVTANDKLLLAVSGGMDSMCLLAAIKSFSTNLAVIHINHGLRKSATAEEKFVRKYCKTHDIEFFFDKLIINTKKNFETEAREKRYRSYQKFQQISNAKFVLTGHHLQDSLETLLINLIRGTGLKGLTGIPQKRDQYLRPFSVISKSKILEYAKNKKIPFMNDSSNFDISISRNRLRSMVVPLFEDLGNNFWAGFAKTIANLSASQEIIDNEVNDWLKKNITEVNNGFRILKSSLTDKSPVFINEVIRIFYAKLNNRIMPSRNLKVVIKLLLSAKKNIQKEFGKNHILYVSNSHLDFKPINQSARKLKIVKIKSLPPKKAINELFVDADKFHHQPATRLPMPGDSFKTFGHNKNQKISKIFCSRKIPVSERKFIPLLMDGEIIAAVGNLEINNDYKLSKKTKNIIKISLV